MWREIVNLLVLSSLTMSILYFWLEGYQLSIGSSVIYPIFIISFIFLLFYLLFALPTYILLKRIKMHRRFSLVNFFTYLFVSLIVHILINSIIMSRSFFNNTEIYIYVVTTSITFWFWESLLLNERENTCY
ncbi:UPF0715 family protein [Cytobacillus sp. IB215665]|uniref:UPF0715 family protein n=1 Tax=Cytobacillus sp. IB215665 TaxID=3097357 RepID=UPI0039B790DC